MRVTNASWLNRIVASSERAAHYESSYGGVSCAFPNRRLTLRFQVLLQTNIAQSLHSPVVIIFLIIIGVGLLYVLGREVRKIPAKLFTLMITAFVDMVG